MVGCHHSIFAALFQTGIGIVVCRIPDTLNVVRNRNAELALAAVFRLTGRHYHAAVCKGQLDIVDIAAVLDRIRNRDLALIAAVLVVADLYRNVIDRITCIDQFADVEVIVIGQVLDSSCRPCTMVHGKDFQFSIAGSRLVHRSLHEEFVPLRSFCRREVRVRGAAVLFYHCTECCGIAGVIVDRNFGILIVADLVGIAVLLIRTADQCTVQNVCVGLGIFALGLSDVAPLVIPCTAGSSVVPCLRIIVTHADHIAKVFGVVAEAVVHDIVSKLGVLFSLGGIVLIQLIDCHICQKCSRGSVAERTPLEQPRQTVRCIGDLLAAVTSRPVFQMLGELVFPLGFAGVDRIQQHAALHHIVPAHAPCVLHFAGLFFLAQIRDIVGLAQIQILLLAGCHVQPVCSIEQIIIECGDLVVRLFCGIIADRTQLVGTVEQVNGVFQIFLCLFRLGVLEVQIAGAECRRHVGSCPHRYSTDARFRPSSVRTCPCILRQSPTIRGRTSRRRSYRQCCHPDRSPPDNPMQTGGCSHTWYADQPFPHRRRSSADPSPAVLRSTHWSV